MTRFLLDASVLIPLMAAEHVHHERATRWAGGVAEFATCPIVEGALVRFAVRLGARTADAQRSLSLLRDRPGFEFWSDSISYVDIGMANVQGHRHVTDAYLVGLASARGGLLATLDEAIAVEWPADTVLLPS